MFLFEAARDLLEVGLGDGPDRLAGHGVLEHRRRRFGGREGRRVRGFGRHNRLHGILEIDEEVARLCGDVRRDLDFDRHRPVRRILRHHPLQRVALAGIPRRVLNPFGLERHRCERQHGGIGGLEDGDQNEPGSRFLRLVRKTAPRLVAVVVNQVRVAAGALLLEEGVFGAADRTAHG